MADLFYSQLCLRILDDGKKLFRDYAVSVSGCIELSLLARSCDTRWKGRYKDPIGLARLTETYLGHRLDKGPVRVSDWSAELSHTQLDCKHSLPYLLFTMFH